MSDTNILHRQPMEIVGEQTKEIDLLSSFVEERLANPLQCVLPIGVMIGELIGMTNEGRTPLVIYPGQLGPKAFAARTVVDLHGQQIGRQVVLMFEAADPTKPIIMGVLRGNEGWPIEANPDQMEVDVDGEQLIVSARKQLVLRCGKSRLCLQADGRIEIHGETIISHATRSNRIRGGSIELN